MDIYCIRCGEPWDTDTFHDVAEETETTYKVALDDFWRRGCEAIPGMRRCAESASLRSQASALMADLLGDDVDGIAGMLDDFEHLGMLD